jgi:GNAT superfamily N-acetyltransferase
VTTYRLTLGDDPSAEDVRFLQDRLYEYNVEQTGWDDGRWLSVLLREADGRIAGGLHGWTWAGWLKVNDFWVREDLRGQGHGTRLLAMAEDEARARGCMLATLDTYSFQAPDFYRKQGYRVVAIFEDFPIGHRQYTLMKELTP